MRPAAETELIGRPPKCEKCHMGAWVVRW
jgi:hypothetical protein